MAPSADHCRLAITAFGEVGVLLRTVTALLQAGLQTDQLCLMGLATAMARIEQIKGALDGRLGQVSELYKQVTDWPGFCDGQSVVATSGQLQTVLRTRGSDMRAMSTADAKSSSMSDFASEIEDGNIALIVQSNDAKQHMLVMRMLLADSSHRVTTYSFLLTGRANPEGSA